MRLAVRRDRGEQRLTVGVVLKDRARGDRARAAISSTVGWGLPSSSSVTSASTIAARVRCDRATRPSCGVTSAESSMEPMVSNIDGRGRRTRQRPDAVIGRSAAHVDALELARPQQREQLAARAVQPDAGDPALLEVDLGAREVVDDLREVRVVADDEDRPSGSTPSSSVARVGDAEASRQRPA